MRHVAVAHGVVIVTRPPVNGLSALRACYADLCASLREVVRDSGRRSGVISNMEVMPTSDPPLPAAA